MSEQSDVCQWCGRKAEKKCDRCDRPFCSAECMRASWETVDSDHRKNCRDDAVGAMLHQSKPINQDLALEKYTRYSPLIFKCKLFQDMIEFPITLDIQRESTDFTREDADANRSWAVTRWKPGQKLLPVNPANTPDRAISEAAVVRDLRAILSPGIVVTSDVVFKQSHLTSLVESLNLPREFDKTFVAEESLRGGKFMDSELKAIYRQIEEWCNLPDPERLRWTAKKICVMKIGPDAEGEPPSGHPVPEGTLTVVALRDLERGTFLGNYAGALTSRGETTNFLFKKPLAYPPTRAYTVDGVVYDADKMLAERTMNRYCIDGLKYRNFMALVNDCAGYVETVDADEDHPATLEAAPSVLFFEFWKRGLPQIGCVLQRPVRKGSELTVEYGARYWYKQAVISPKEKVAIERELDYADSLIVPSADLSFNTIDDVGMGLLNGNFRGVVLVIGPPATKFGTTAFNFVSYAMQNSKRYNITRCYGKAHEETSFIWGSSGFMGEAAQLFTDIASKPPKDKSLLKDVTSVSSEPWMNWADLIISIGKTAPEVTNAITGKKRGLALIVEGLDTYESTSTREVMVAKGTVDDVVCRLAYAMAIEDIVVPPHT